MKSMALVLEQVLSEAASPTPEGARQRSPIELRMRTMLRRFRPILCAEAVIHEERELGLYRADFLVVFPGGVSVVVECDGYTTHGVSPHAFAYDRARDRWMQARGFVVLRFTFAEIEQSVARCAGEVYTVGMGLAGLGDPRDIVKARFAAQAGR